MVYYTRTTRVSLKTKMFTAVLMVLWIFSGLPPFFPEFYFGSSKAEAAVSDIGIWRDSIGGQLPGTSFGAFNFATQERNDGIYTFSGNNNLNFDEAGNYLLIATIKMDDASNGRVNYEGRFNYTGSGDFVTLYGSGYSRNSANRTSWVRVAGLVWGAAANDDVQLEMRRDTDAPTGGSVLNASHFQVVKLHDSAAVGMYTDTSDTSGYGTTTWTDAPFNNTVLESDTGVIERQAGNTNIRLKKNATTFLVGYGMAFGSGGSRTQRVTKMVSGSSDIPHSFSYAYQRSSANEYIAPNGLFLYRNSGTSTDLSVQAQLGLADVAGSAARRTGTSGMFVVELPATVESFISHDNVGGQDIGGTNGSYNAMTVVDHNDAAGFTKVNNTTMNIEKNMNVLLMGQAYAERSDTSGTRMTSGGRFEIAGTDQALGEHGNYLRGNQGTQDTYNFAAHPSGMYSVTNDDDIVFEFFDAGDNGSADNTVASAVGFSALNLDSLLGDAPITNQLHFRWRDDTTDLNTSGGFLAAEDSNAIGDITKNTTHRLRIEVANTGTQPESAARTYELQWGEKVTSCTAISTWTGVSDASDTFDMTATAHITPDGESTTSGLLANTETYTRVNGEGRESADTTSSIGALSAGSYTELEFSFEATDDAVTGHTYCFRLYDTTAGSALDSYSQYPEVTISSVDAVSALGEAGIFTSSADGGWTNISFTNSYTTPVVVGTTNTTGGTENALIFESRNVTSTSADMRVCESDGHVTAGCGTHGTETVGYMVIDATAAADIDGIEAGTFSASGDYDVNGTTINYSESFSSTPYVFGAVQTMSGTGAVEFRMETTSATSFHGGICRQNGTDTCDASQGSETVGWVALEPGNIPFAQENEMGTVVNTGGGSWNSVTFASAFSATPAVISEVQTFSGTQELMIDENRSVSTTGVDVRFCELDGPDTCDSHNSNTVAWVALEVGSLTVTPTYVLDQTTFRMYDNANSVQPGSAKAAENTEITDVASSDVLRLRIAVQVGKEDLVASSESFKLQYGEGNTCSAIATWTDVDGLSGSGIWRGYNNAAPSDGATITSSLLNGGGNTLESYEEENNSVSNPNTITKGTRGEWDWVVENNGALGGTTYCFRMVTADGSALQYTNYPKVTTLGVTLTQNYFRFYVDNDALDPTDPWPSGATDLGENAEVTVNDEPLETGDAIRLRMSVAISDTTLAAAAQEFKLQFGERVTTCSAIGSWTDLGAPGSGALWRGVNGTPADGTNLSVNPPTAGDLNISVSDRAGTYEEQNNSAVNPFQVSVGEDVEYDWHVENNGALGDTSYCFRMIKDSGAELSGYNFYPAVHTAGFMPHSQNWRWYDDETNSTPIVALAAENTTPIEIVSQNSIKLRLTIQDVNGVAGTDIKFKLQFAETSDFTDVADVVEDGSCTSTSVWCYGDGVDTDNDPITTRVLSDSTANGTHNESGISSSTFDVLASTPTEFEFTIRSDGAYVGTTYYFRAYDVTNDIPVPVNTGETYPSVITESPALTFTVAGLGSGVATEGITTDVATTATSIAFGSVPLNTPIEAAQRISVDTNANNGYQVLAYARSDFIGSSGSTIEAVAGTNASPTGWTTGCSALADSCFGYHSGDDVLESGSTRFAPDDSYAAFSATPDEFLYSDTAVTTETHDVVYKIEVHPLQPADLYSTDIVYIATPTF